MQHRHVTLCLTAFAQLALVQAQGERAALLAGAAEGLRQRVGLRAWPLQQQGEAQAVAQIRQALGADRFDQNFAAGVRLDRRQGNSGRPRPVQHRRHCSLLKSDAVHVPSAVASRMIPATGITNVAAPCTGDVAVPNRVARRPAGSAVGSER